MDDQIRFIGLAFDDDRDKATPTDLRRIAEALERQGFRTVSEMADASLLVWREDSNFAARLALEDNWMLQVTVDPRLLDVDEETNRPHFEALSALIGVAAEAADTYLGFVSTDPDDDLSFVVEDPPVRLDEPLALVYFGRRYLIDWPDEPAFAADAELDVTLPAGRLVVPSLEELG